jgi:hypothetical protein
MEYRKKPVVIEAHQFDGTSTGVSEINHWMFTGKLTVFAVRTRDIGPLKIPTLEGEMTASKGDYIIKGLHGEFYPCKPDIFDASYDVVTKGEG